MAKTRKILRPVRVAGVRYRAGEEDKLHRVLGEDDAERLVKDGALEGVWAGGGKEAPEPRAQTLAGLQPVAGTLMQASLSDESVAERERALADRERALADREAGLAQRESALAAASSAPAPAPTAATTPAKPAEGAGKTG